NCSGVSGQYVRMLRSDRASAGNDGVGRAESRPSRIGPINLDVKQMGERNAGNPHVAFDVAGAGDVAWSRGISAKAGAPVLDPTDVLGYAHISCGVRIGIRKRLRAYDAVRFGSLRQPEDTNRNGLVAWIIRGCPAR